MSKRPIDRDFLVGKKAQYLTADSHGRRTLLRVKINRSETTLLFGFAPETSQMATGRPSLLASFSGDATLAAPSRLALSLALAACVLGGCGSATNSHPTARLEGKLTIDDQPVHSGRIQFFPKGPGQPDDAEVADGHYLAERVPSGKVRVTFTAVKATGKMIHEPGHVFPELVSIVPEQYQSGMEIEIVGDNSDQNFNLVSKPSETGGKGR